MLEAAPEAGGADDLIGAVDLRLDAEAALASSPLDRLVPAPSRRVGGRAEGAQELCSPGPRRGAEAGEPTLGEERSRDVQRAACGLAAADGDDLRAGRERVQPLGRRGHPGADDRHASGVLVRRIGVDRARVVLELRRQRETRVPRREQDVAEGAVRIELEAAVDRPHLLHTGLPPAPVPAAPVAQLVDVAEELVDRRPVAVADAQEERDRRPAPRRLPRGEAGEAGRVAVAVALGAHALLADRGRTHAPRPGRIVRVAEDGDLLRVEPGVTQRRVRDEAAEPGTDDGAARHPRYLTEPASRP